MTIEKLIEKAYIELEVGNYQQAISDFSDAEKMDSKNFMVYYGKGKAYLAEARSNFEKASNLKDTYARDILGFIDAIEFKERK